MSASLCRICGVENPSEVSGLCDPCAERVRPLPAEDSTADDLGDGLNGLARGLAIIGSVMVAAIGAIYLVIH
jgi:hypothetical protein